MIKKQAGKSKAVPCREMVRLPPERREHTGRISVRSMTLAPMMLPMDSALSR